MSVGVPELDVCVVSDALDVLGLSGSVAGIRPVWEGSRMSGRVITMKVAIARGQRAPRHLGAMAIDLARPGDVIVIEQERIAGELSSATWGGLLSLAAAARGIAGVVVDGACRDIDEIRNLGLPVSAAAVMPFTARRRCVEHSVGEDIVVGGVTVSTGDQVMADASGVVFIRAADTRKVLQQAARLMRREELMARHLRAGRAASEVLGASYEEMLDAS
jgi:4-hydroxy-4-methyl-2-oxoglutarate aldolase